MNRYGIAAAVALSVVLAQVPASAATHEIGTGGDWTTVIANAAAGDTIQVRLGAPAPVNVLINKQLVITNYPGESPVLDGAGTAYSAFGFDANGSGSAISGLAFQNYTGYALRTSSGTPAITVSSCVFDNCGWTFGLEVTASNCEIKNAAKGGYAIHGSSFTGCTFTNLSQQAVAYSNNLSFTGCTFTNVATVVAGGNSAAFDNVTISGSSVVTSGTGSVSVANSTLSNVSNIAFSGPSSITITGSTFTNVKRGVYSGSNVTIENLVVTGGTYLTGWCSGVTISNVSTSGLSYVASGGSGLTLNNLTVDGAVEITDGVNDVIAANLVLKNVSYIAFCGGTNVSVTDATFENVARGAYDISGLTFTNITQTGTGSYLVGWCDNVVIENVSAESIGYFVGGGDNVVIRNSTAKNMASYGIANCNNVSTEGVRIDGGSMAFCGDTALDVYRTIIANHRSGACEAFYTSYGMVTNSTIVNNGRVLAWLSGNTLDFDSCIVWGNDVFNHGCPRGVGTAVYSILPTDTDTALTLGDGNLLNVNPLFVDAVNGNYALQTGSPAIDAGNPGLPVPPQGGGRVDMGAVEYVYALHGPVYSVGAGQEFPTPQAAVDALVANAQLNGGILPEDSEVRLYAGTYSAAGGDT